MDRLTFHHGVPDHPCSPHTRGWTGFRRHVNGGGLVLFPAHAGMDRIPSPREWWRVSTVPRTRGDGPAGRVRRAWQVRCSPHTRGWTADRDVSRRAGTGLFPAHAGMDRPVAPLPLVWLPVPRTRGDGPNEKVAAVTCIEPVPRTRGDGPCTDERYARATPPCSPHTRGWTEAIAAILNRHLPVPRTRGDGPNGSIVLSAQYVCSPHTRGWTGLISGWRPWLLACSPHTRGWTGLVPTCSGPEMSVPRTRGDGPMILTA